MVNIVSAYQMYNIFEALVEHGFPLKGARSSRQRQATPGVSNSIGHSSGPFHEWTTQPRRVYTEGILGHGYKKQRRRLRFRLGTIHELREREKHRRVFRVDNCEQRYSLVSGSGRREWRDGKTFFVNHLVHPPYAVQNSPRSSSLAGVHAGVTIVSNTHVRQIFADNRYLWMIDRI